MYIIGDTHGLMNLYNILSRFFIEHPQIENPTFIHVGDVGIGFYPWERDFAILKNIDNLLQENGAECLCIRGNHDRPDYFNNYNSPIERDLNNLTNFGLISDYETLIIEGRKILFIGGAVSIDRQYRVEDRDWWRHEKVIEMFTEMFDMGAYQDIDTVITHTSPTGMFPLADNPHDMFGIHIGNDIHRERTYLREVYDTLNDKHPIRNWFYGHYHTSEIGYWGDTRFECVNQDCIVEFNPN